MVCARFCITISILLHDQLRLDNAADVTLDVDVKLRNRRPVIFTSYKFLDKVNFFHFTNSLALDFFFLGATFDKFYVLSTVISFCC